jgi:hypothetical protein
MRTRFTLLSGTIITIVLFVSSCQKKAPAFCNCSADDLIASVSVFSSGLNAPRGLKFGPDGYLYVAEGGLGGAPP